MNDKKTTIREHIEKNGLPETAIIHKDQYWLKSVFESMGIKVFLKQDYDESVDIIFMGQHAIEKRKDELQRKKELWVSMENFLNN